MQQWGCFPFGRPNTIRPARTALTTDLLIVGVYPSAWHVQWTAPKVMHLSGVARGVKALAVDVEPKVFWDGTRDDFTARAAAWRQGVEFRDGDTPGCDGNVSTTNPPTNGSSGKKVISHYLGRLDMPESRTSFTDIFPVFMVKRSASSKAARGRREQGDAIAEDYDPFAAFVGRPKASLPLRIAPRELPGEAIKHFARRLRDDIAQTRPALIISLGEEVWDALMAWPGVSATPPVDRFAELKSARYGSLGVLSCNGHRADWLPLVHPGLLPPHLDHDVEANHDSPRTWVQCHTKWARSRGSTS